MRPIETKIKWPASYREGVEIQERLRSEVVLQPFHGRLRLIGGVDAAVDKKEKRIYVSILIFSYPGLELVEEATASEDTVFPYIPGLLSFREGPAIITAYQRLMTRPDVMVFDGQGIAHPRGFGVASHMGVLLGLPTIGCAKSRLVGEYKEPGFKKGDFSRLFYEGKEVGAVLRTKDGVRPVFVSPGHRIDLKSSIDIILSLCRGYRLPEPVRLAHIRVGRFKEGAVSSKQV